MIPRRVAAAAVFVATLAAAASAHAYVIQKTSGGKDVRWFYMPEDFFIDTHGYSQITDGSLLTAEQASFTPWADVPQCDASYTLKTSSHGVSDIFDSSSNAPVRDRINEMAFVEDDWAGRNLAQSLIALTFTYFSDSSGKILENDIVANGVDYVWTDTDTNVQTDVRNFLTHEVGHSYGLGHNPDDPEATMFPTGTQGETKKRDLDGDDIAGIQHSYPPGCCKHTRTGDFLAMFGCDVAPRPLSPWPWIVTIAGIAAAVLFRRRTARSRAAASVLLGASLLAAAGSARATVAVRMPLESLVAEADVVAHGTVVYTQPLVLPTGPILTLVQIEVADSWKGNAPRVLTLVELGGVGPDDVAMHVEGAPVYQQGDEVVVFATALRGGLASEFPDAYRTSGFSQGEFRVLRGAGAPPRVVRDLGGMMRVAAGREGFIPVVGDELSGLSLADLSRAVQQTR
ncbi:MAG TPA: matrixin family metalloprotease [bacterium]|nr:matrixin family metalloprotease [bacterium]